MTFQFTNNAATTLASGVSGSATSLILATGKGALFPTPSGANVFRVTLIRASDSAIEIVECTARSSDTLTVTRAQEGTTSLVFVTGDKIELRVTAGVMNALSSSGGGSGFSGVATATGNTALTSTPTILSVTPASSAVVVTLPDATTCTVGGPVHVVLNQSKAYSLGVNDYVAPRGVLPPSSMLTAYLLNNSTTAGVWALAVSALLLVTYPVFMLVVGGGGGGCSGGGGAGGVRTKSINAPVGGTYVVTVGAGGAGGVSTGAPASTNGFLSSFGGELVSAGGGGGGTDNGANAKSGASGGGGGASGYAAVQEAGLGNSSGVSPVEGYAGGSNGGVLGSPYPAGGGGGAGGVGGIPASASVSGVGGSGITSTEFGVSVGGGGGGASLYAAGTGGSASDGGGAGRVSSGGNGTDGTANTGGGGGGGTTTYTGGAGGSGGVWIRYPDNYPAAASTTGSPTITTSGGYRYYVWTASGSITF